MPCVYRIVSVLLLYVSFSYLVPVRDRTVTPRCLGMWRLDSVVKGGRTVQEMVVVVKIYIFIYKGLQNPNTVPTK